MARPKNSVPRFYVRSNGFAFTKISGQVFALGRADSPESKLRFAKLLEDHAQGLLVDTAKKSPDSRRAITIGELLLQFVAHEFPRYSESERGNFRTTIRVLREFYGETPVDEFGPLKLRIVRDAMVAGNPDARPEPRQPWSRGTTNRQIKRLQAIFRWGVSFELVAPDIAAALDTLRVLKRGETPAAESKPRKAIPADHLAAVRDELKPLYRDVFDLMLLTGARPGEILSVTTSMIDRTGEAWICELKNHKNEHKGKARYLVFNIAAQRILLRNLKADPDAKLFGCRRDNFTTAVKRACVRAKVPVFSPHLLRHTVGTTIVDKLGYAEAQALLGHATEAMTRLYSRAATGPAKRAAQALDDAERTG